VTGPRERADQVNSDELRAAEDEGAHAQPMETAMQAATRPHDFKLLVQGEGKVGTTMEDVARVEEAAEQAEAEAAVPAGRDPANLIPGL